MHDQTMQAAALAAIANGSVMPFASLPAGVMIAPAPRKPNRRPGAIPELARKAARGAQLIRWAAAHPAQARRRAVTFARTCVRAAKYLPTVRRAVPWYVWPVLGLASAVKCMPLDFGADETLFAIAFALIAWRRPGLLKALYREAQAGKPARCQCGQHARKLAGLARRARLGVAR